MKNPERVQIEAETLTAPKIDQIFYEVNFDEKFEALTRLIDMDDGGRFLVFCHTKREVDAVTSSLKLRGYDAEAMLYRMGARDYQPETGRWLTQDRYIPGIGQINHPFTYVANDGISDSNVYIKNKATSYDSLKYAGMWIKENSNKTDFIFSAGIPQNTYYSERETSGYPRNESEFLRIIQERRPKYMILSVWETAPEWMLPIARTQQGAYHDWANSLPEKNKNMTRIVQAYFFDAQKKQVSAVIYELIY